MITLPKERMTAQDVLDFVVAHYGADPKGRRSVVQSKHAGETCLYDSPSGCQCAFRIFVKDEHQMFVNDSRTESGDNPNAAMLLDVAMVKGFDLLRGEVRHLSDQMKFWNNIQRLHDSSKYWNMEQGGLSEAGIIAAESIEQMFATLLTQP